MLTRSTMLLTALTALIMHPVCAQTTSSDSASASESHTSYTSAAPHTMAASDDIFDGQDPQSLRLSLILTPPMPPILPHNPIVAPLPVAPLPTPQKKTPVVQPKLPVKQPVKNDKTASTKPAVAKPAIVLPPGMTARLLNTVPTTAKDGTDNKNIAITFDDGPDPTYTPQILALLKENGIHATFCVVGRQVKKNPTLVAQIIAEGHKLANHSMNHDECLPLRSDSKLRQEVLAENALIDTACPGAKVEFFRAPAGNWNLHLRQLAASWGMKSLGWSIDTKDWQQPGTDAIVNLVNNRIHSGAVILMHDGGGNRSQSVAALKQLLPTLKKDGYNFVLPQ